MNRVTWVWRMLILAAGVTGLYLSWVSHAGPLGPLVFFTIQSNIVVATYFAFLLAWPWLREKLPGNERLTRARSSLALRGAITLYIVITGLIYSVVLNHLGNPLHFFSEGSTGVGTFLLHYLVPPMAVLDFLLLERRPGHQWRYAAVWLAYPLSYLAYALIRGAFFTKGQYPYPFLNVTKDGYPGVIKNAFTYAILFYLLGLAVVLLGRLTSGLAASDLVKPAVRSRRQWQSAQPGSAGSAGSGSRDASS